ncbi:MAG TPA: tetratricopeptide repeat protein [Methanosarcinaceae archaeon]|nr:tetratricopeptide repeat protein [Methanosarcinaceae archaeon]
MNGGTDFLKRINGDLFTEGMDLIERDPAEAIIGLKKLIDENPNESNLWWLLGNVYKDIDEKLKALESYEKAIELDPENYMALDAKGRIIIDKNPKEAIKCFDARLELEENAEIYYLKGLSTQFIKDYTESVYCFNKALEIEMVNPTPAYQSWHYDAWNYKGVSLMHLNAYEEAIVSFNQAIEIDPNIDTAWVGKYNGLEKLENYDGAMECLAKIKSIRGTEIKTQKNNDEELKRQIATLNSEIKNHIKKRNDKFIEAGEIAYSECIATDYNFTPDIKTKLDDILALDTLIDKTNTDIVTEKSKVKKTGFLAKLGGAVSSAAKQGKFKLDLYNFGTQKKSAIKDFGEILWGSFKTEGFMIDSISNIWEVVEDIDKDINVKENKIKELNNTLETMVVT